MTFKVIPSRPYRVLRLGLCHARDVWLACADPAETCRRSILSSEASFSSSASAARFPEASVERSDTSSYFPARIGSLETSQHTRSLVTRLMIASRAPYKTHSEDPAPLSMQDLLALVDDELEQS